LRWQVGKPTSRHHDNPGRKGNFQRVASLRRQILEVLQSRTLTFPIITVRFCSNSTCSCVAAEVYVPRGGQDNTDVTKRGGRYTSDFVWNTKWQDTVCTYHCCQCSAVYPASDSMYFPVLQLDRQQAREEAELAKQNAPQEAKAGGLSFSRVSDMQRYEAHPHWLPQIGTLPSHTSHLSALSAHQML